MALSFTGSEYVVLAGESGFDFDKDTAYSVFIWINHNNVSLAGSQTYISKLNNNAPNDGWEFTKDYVDTNEMLVYLINTFPTSTSARITTDANLAVLTWYCLGYTYDGVGNNNAEGHTIYKNGSAPTNSNRTDTLTTSALNNLSVYIGRREGSSTLYLKARAALVVVFTGVISSTIIAGLSKGINPFVYLGSTMVCCLPLDGISSTEPDHKANAHKGTVTSAAKFAGNPPVQLLSRWLSMC